jgi:hypothetical protein
MAALRKLPLVVTAPDLSPGRGRTGLGTDQPLINSVCVVTIRGNRARVC